jgi:hypothetical protein
MKARSVLIVATAIYVAACSSESVERAERFTLYRNSFLDNSMRVHWGTFDANEKDRNYNRNNCEMAARLLNANLDASARAEGKDRDPLLGFWCEPGSYSDKGIVPSSFPAAFPTDA